MDMWLQAELVTRALLSFPQISAEGSKAQPAHGHALSPQHHMLLAAAHHSKWDRGPRQGREASPVSSWWGDLGAGGEGLG